MQNAGMYTMGTTMMGGGAFKESVQEACDCVPEQDVAARQREELLAFYKKWAPDQAGKAEGLLKKYADNFPRLMMMLGQKYRDSIAIIKKDEKFTQDDEFKRLNPPKAQPTPQEALAEEMSKGQKPRAPERKEGEAKPPVGEEEEQEL